MDRIRLLIKLIILLLCLFTIDYFIKKDNQNHYCIDSTHNTCDGACECDGMECK